MIRFRKVKAVTTFEFMTMVRRKGYIIATLAIPLVVIAYGGMIGFVGRQAAKKEQEKKLYGIVDDAQALRISGDQKVAVPEVPPEVQLLLKAAESRAPGVSTLLSGAAAFRAYDTVEQARQALLKEQIKGYCVIDKDYFKTGKIDMYAAEKGSSITDSHVDRQLREMLLQRMLIERLPSEIAERVKDPTSELKEWVVAADGTVHAKGKFEEMAKVFTPLLIGMLMLMSILGTSGYLVQAVATEKENKVVDVLICSASPDEILFGKLLGLGAAGLIQVGIWFGMAGGTAAVMAGALSAMGVTLPWLAIAVAPPLFVLGYLFIGALMIGTASLGSTTKESQQMIIVWTLLTVSPFWLFMVLLTDPTATICKVMTFIPFTAALTTVMRLSIAPASVQWWEVAGAFVSLLLSLWGAIWIGGKLFRVGLLLTGSRPKFGEILRQAGIIGRAA